jgi:hypothetical protein
VGVFKVKKKEVMLNDLVKSVTCSNLISLARPQEHQQTGHEQIPLMADSPLSAKVTLKSEQHFCILTPTMEAMPISSAVIWLNTKYGFTRIRLRGFLPLNCTQCSPSFCSYFGYLKIVSVSFKYFTSVIIICLMEIAFDSSFYFESHLGLEVYYCSGYHTMV